MIAAASFQQPHSDWGLDHRQGICLLAGTHTCFKQGLHVEHMCKPGRWKNVHTWEMHIFHYLASDFIAHLDAVHVTCSTKLFSAFTVFCAWLAGIKERKKKTNSFLHMFWICCRAAATLATISVCQVSVAAVWQKINNQEWDRVRQLVQERSLIWSVLPTIHPFGHCGLNNSLQYYGIHMLSHASAYSR